MKRVGRTISAEKRHDPLGISRCVLTVRIDDEHVLTRRVPDSRFHGGPIAFVVGVSDDAGAGRCSRSGGLVLRAVIDHQDFVPGRRMQNRLDDNPDSAGLLIGRNHYADG